MMRAFVPMLATVFFIGAGQGSLAQPMTEAARPAELPPASYTGKQYVDSRGCVFVRAGLGGKTVWVPRVTQDRKVLCGYPPTFAKAQPSSDTVSQHPNAGGSAASTSPAMLGAQVSRGNVPKGFRPAWTDNRLNPLRGPRTAQGNAQMNRIWTQTVPRRLISEKALWGHHAVSSTAASSNSKSQSLMDRALALAGKFSLSSKSVTPLPQAQGRFIQIGTFGLLSNAQQVLERLTDLGLPSEMREYSRNGRLFHLVLAGPFSKTKDLHDALIAAQQAGYGDAFIR